LLSAENLQLLALLIAVMKYALVSLQSWSLSAAVSEPSVLLPLMLVTAPPPALPPVPVVPPVLPALPVVPPALPAVPVAPPPLPAVPVAPVPPSLQPVAAIVETNTSAPASSISPVRIRPPGSFAGPRGRLAKKLTKAVRSPRRR
jgi:type IV secretory pathway VirB10-like protein